MEQRKPLLTVYYDGFCRICSGIADHVAESSKKDQFAFVDISVAPLPETISATAAQKDVHVADSSGRIYVGIDGVLKIIEHYRGGRALAWMGRLPPIRQTLALLYRLVADNRRWIFKQNKKEKTS